MKRVILVLASSFLFGACSFLPQPIPTPTPGLEPSPVPTTASTSDSTGGMDMGNPTGMTKSLEKPSLTIDVKKNYKATLVTSKGNIVIALTANATPITVNNFVYLANNHFYDNTIFHRVIKGFMIQGGDPNGNGTGGPGYKFDDEPFTGEYTRGTVAMANSGTNTNGSQFFIMHADKPLPKNYVIFGNVVEGMDVVDKIAASPVKENAMGEASTPADPVMIQSVQITEQ